MKKLIFILIAFLFSGMIYAQSTLEFNSVLFEQMTSLNGADPVLDLVVPSGQVLKITSAITTTHTNCYLQFKLSTISSTYYLNILRNNEPSYGSETNASFPLWLPAGSYNFRLLNASSSSEYTAVISGIYFNKITN